MQKGVKFRLYPNKEQKNLINQTLGCCRLIYNKGLAMRKEAYANGSKMGYTQTSAMLTELKKSKEYDFLKVVDSIALQQSLRDLDRSFVNFFKKRAGYPAFKSKHNHHQSYRTINQGDNIRIVGKYIKLPNVSWSKFFEMLTYKAYWYGNNIIKVPTMYPSSQTCSNCGYKNPLVKNLAIRKWECPECGAIHDRDANAGINILQKGLQMQAA